ncbi:MAG: radical SAM protein [Candidatus Omnitrophica bacterium]|nr:radical SAM protein [Candidatus Omnitrophota bacterium]
MQNINKKLLIVKPPYRHIPMGIAYVLSCLEKNNIPFDFIDATFTRPNYKKLFKKNDYLAFATGGLISNYDFISKTIRVIRSIRDDLPVIMGGNITKDVNPEFLFDKDMLGIDYGIIGEAETSLPYLIDRLNNGSESIQDIPGLIFKNKGTGQITKNVPMRFNLQDVNVFPAWHRINMEFYKYSDVSYMANQVVLPVVTGRGCVGVCAFCSPTVGVFQKRPVGHVMEEIDLLFSRYNFDILNILNEMFYQNKEDILQFCQEYKKLKVRKPWMAAMRVDVKGIDEDTFVAMKEAGCILTGAGIESGSNKVLKIMKKLTSKEQIINFYRWSKKTCLPSLGTFMVGNEREAKEDIKETIDMVIAEEMNCDASLTHAYPGTQIYKNALKRGLVSNERDYYKRALFTPTPYDLSWINREAYLNISDIPNDRFWEVIFGELRRFYTFLYKRFRVIDLQYKYNRLFSAVVVIGICSECGSPIKIHSSFDLLGQLTYCPKCYSVLYADYYKLIDFSGHFDFLCRQLMMTEKLIIVGTELQAMNLLRYDHFGLNFKKIKGFLDFKKKGNQDSLFAYIPKIKTDELLSILPDTILVADDQAYDAELKLMVFYSRNKISVPKILNLIPHNKAFGLNISKYVRKFITRLRIRGIIYRMICSLAILLLESIALFPKAIPFLAQKSKPFLKRVLGAAFARKLRRLCLKLIS